MFNGTKIQYSEFGGERALYRPSRVLFVSKIESGGKPLSEDNVKLNRTLVLYTLLPSISVLLFLKLFSIFSKHGKVEKAYVSVDKTGHSFYGIVQMSSLEVTFIFVDLPSYLFSKDLIVHAQISKFRRQKMPSNMSMMP